TVPRKSKLQPKASIRKKTVTRSQIRLSSYFEKASSPAYSNIELADMIRQLQDKVSNLETESKKLRLMLKRRRKLSTRKHSSLYEYKKSKKSKKSPTPDPEPECTDIPV